MKIVSDQVVIEDNHSNLTMCSAVISIQNSMIVKVEKISASQLMDIIEKTKKSEIYDARGKMVTPSFVNVHTHLAMNAFRGMDFSHASKTNMVEDGFLKLKKNFLKKM
jgi:5-methylthioadenosine/S-adenosylhomocysteine deaminase